MNNIAGFGGSVQIRASVTFPAGFTVTQFADDVDPIDTPSNQIADAAEGLNGDMVYWSVAKIIQATLGVIPGSDDDVNLGILLEANRAGRGKVPARDEVTMTILYPSGRTVTLTPGIISDGMTADSIASAGRLKSKPYVFKFENRIGTN